MAETTTTTITEIYVIKTVVDEEAEEYGTSSVTVLRLTDVTEDIVSGLEDLAAPKTLEFMTEDQRIGTFDNLSLRIASPNNGYEKAIQRIRIGTLDDQVADIARECPNIINALAVEIVREMAQNTIEIPCVFPESPKDWGTFTGSFMLSDGEKVLVAHHAADEDEEEWTEVRQE